MATTLDKPAGLPVFPPHTGEGDSLLARLLADQPWRAAIAWPEGFAGGIAHRLDNATSGCVVAADSIDELVALRDAFARHALTKTYRLLASRDVPWHDNTCDRPIAHDARRRQRMIVQRGPNTPHRGRWYEAETRFRRVRGRLFEAVIRTGVTHQIRVHAAFVGIPLLGDRLYGGAPTDDGRFFLHCVGMTGPGGFTTAPLPLPDWAR